ncbi:hypothetical protein P3S67_027977 [Capsicum chacoense]
MDSLENQKKQGAFWDIDTGLDLFNVPELISANNFAENLKPYQKSLKLDWNPVFISPDPSPYPDQFSQGNMLWEENVKGYVVSGSEEDELVRIRCLQGLCGMHILESKDVEKVPVIGTYQLISYHEIQRVTNNFDGSNLIGEGSSGFEYKGTLSNGTVVAIKVLDLENEQVCKRFDTECKVMRNVTHRNLVPVITTCSSEYIRAFVLQYMSNRILENWLYGEDFHLNLLQRVTVIVNAAMAIEYLHHGNGTPIVHCDLKPANVLLDEDMVAHVGDLVSLKF